jgi:hypothetical protein
MRLDFEPRKTYIYVEMHKRKQLQFVEFKQYVFCTILVPQLK